MRWEGSPFAAVREYTGTACEAEMIDWLLRALVSLAALLLGPAGWVLGTWLLLLAVWPEWTISRWWSPVNADRMRALPWYLRLGLDPDTTSARRYRLVGSGWLLGLMLFCLVFRGGDVGLGALLGLMLAVFVVSVLWALVAVLRVFSRASTLEQDSWITAGFPRMERRAPRIRLMSLLTLCGLTATAAPFLYFLLALGPSVIWMNPDLSPYEEFYSLTDTERSQAIKGYPLEEQIDIYLVGELRLHHGSFLADDLAANGAAIIPPLVERLVSTTRSYEKIPLLRAFLHMKYAGSYAVASDEKLMQTLEREARAIDHDSSDDYAMQIIEWIRMAPRSADVGNGN